MISIAGRSATWDMRGGGHPSFQILAGIVYLCLLSIGSGFMVVVRRKTAQLNK